MNIEELAEYLDGREYRDELPPDMELKAKESGLVVVFGSSDDIIEFGGAIRDDGYCYEGGSFLVDSKGIIAKPDECMCNDDNEDEWKTYFERKEKGKIIEAIWGKEYCWEYKTEIPHRTFEIMEDGEKYCMGIVFELKELS